MVSSFPESDPAFLSPYLLPLSLCENNMTMDSRKPSSQSKASV